MTRTPSSKTRLQKLLADAGFASRRRAEELILEGHVLVNDEVVDTLPAFVDPQHDRVIIDGVPVRQQKLDYFIVNKPKGVVCAEHNPAGRVRAVDLLPDLPARLKPVGRLEEESSGLLLLTNDNELALRLTNPRSGVPKTYHAEVRGRVPRDLPALLKAGVYLSEGRAQASRVEILHSSGERSTMLITLREVHPRQVRRMFARLGFPVRKLKCIEIGPLSLHKLPLGAARRLSPRELAALRAAMDASNEEARTQRRRRKPTPGGPPARPSSTAAPKTTKPTDSRPRRRVIT